MPNDPFSVLGISSSATEDEIKAAYRKLAKKYHPDLNPGDKTAEQKMREVNEAYTRALQIKKTGQDPYRDPYGSSSSSSGASGYYNPFGGAWGGGQGGYRQQDYYSREGSGGQDPFGDFGFDPFSAFFGGQAYQQQQQTRYRTRSYANPELKTAENHVLSNRFHEAVNLLNRIPTHDADWHALYARADLPGIPADPQQRLRFPFRHLRQPLPHLLRHEHVPELLPRRLRPLRHVLLRTTFIGYLSNKKSNFHVRGSEHFTLCEAQYFTFDEVKYFMLPKATFHSHSKGASLCLFSNVSKNPLPAS